MRTITRHDLVWMAGIGAATAAFLFLVARPQFGRVSELKEALRTEQELAKEGRSDLRELPRAQAEVDVLRKQVAQFEHQVPTEDRLGDYMERLASAAQDHRLRADAIEPGAPVRSGDLQAVSIVLKVHGPFREVYGLLQDVEGLPRLTQVERFDAKAAPDRPGEVQAEMQLRVFYRAS